VAEVAVADIEDVAVDLQHSVELLRATFTLLTVAVVVVVVVVLQEVDVLRTLPIDFEKDGKNTMTHKMLENLETIGKS